MEMLAACASYCHWQREPRPGHTICASRRGDYGCENFSIRSLPVSAT